MVGVIAHTAPIIVGIMIITGGIHTIMRGIILTIMVMDIIIIITTIIILRIRAVKIDMVNRTTIMRR